MDENPMAGKSLLKGLGVTIDHLLERHKRRPRASWRASSLGRWMSQEGGGRWSLLSTQHWSDQQCVQFWIPPCKKDMLISEWVHDNEKGLEHLSSEKWLKKFEHVVSWKTWGHHINVYEYLRGKNIRHWNRLPREASFLSLEILKSPTRPTCSRSLSFAQESCDRRSPVKPSNPNLPVILWTC